ncbi:M56 family metallopeptidase [Parasphingorhabdus sp.]|uniref:M56 family metallopeptidase n=1 Tax=Parasphingorhabdus sp. TaxID=2709688 RepID=UPI002F93360E
MTNWMMDTMVSMTLLMVLVLMLRKPVSRFFGPHIAYLLWTLPLARLFMPTLTLKAPAPVEGAEAAAATPLLSTVANNISGQNMTGLHLTEQSAVMSSLASVDWVLIALVLWIGGAGLLFITKLASYFQFREDIISDGHLVGRHGRIKILETAAVGGPLAFGLLEKYIAVPTNFFRDYAPRERELALEHEIAHHESGDLAANFVGLLVLSLHWFNPVAWFAWTAFRQDQETACDARVLQKGLQNGGRNVRAVYGRTIAKSVSGRQLGLASPLNQKNKIKDRLIMLGQSEKSAFRKRMGALMVGASTALALPLTATVTYAVEAEAQPVEGAEAYVPPKAHLENKDIAVITQQPAATKSSLAETLPVPPAPPVPPAAPPAAPATPVRADEMPDKEEIRSIAKEAARQARYDAKEKLKAAEIARQEARQELRVALAKANREVREAQHNARAIQREAMEAAREAQREALQKGMAARVWEISQFTIQPYFRSAIGSVHQSGPVASSAAECVTVSRKITVAGTGATSWTYVEANIAGCPETEQPDTARKAALTAASKSLENKQTAASRCPETGGDQMPIIEVAKA